ncbi:MAG TPA: hypothetical protein VNM67_07440 [Thermoanaerobaculia bacterium]|nr:hypothetical protein [Thermoanaerobaculia bacterium]
MRSMTTFAGIVGIGVFLMAALAAPVQAEVVVNDSTEIALVAFVPCANGGAGELVELTGPLHTLISFTINGNNVSGLSHFQPQGISGVGLTTGDTYHATGVTTDHFKGSFNNGQFNETYVNNFRIIGQGPGNNFLVHENFHFTINANGELTAVHDNFSIECR